MKCAKCDENPNFRELLEALQSRSQRASYAAVAGLLGGSHRSLLSDHEKDPLHSWVVNGTTKLPTGYATNNLHEKLERNSKVIDTKEGLRRILGSQPVRTSLQKPRNSY